MHNCSNVSSAPKSKYRALLALIANNRSLSSCNSVISEGSKITLLRMMLFGGIGTYFRSRIITRSRLSSTLPSGYRTAKNVRSSSGTYSRPRKCSNTQPPVTYSGSSSPSSLLFLCPFNLPRREFHCALLIFKASHSSSLYPSRSSALNVTTPFLKKSFSASVFSVRLSISPISSAQCTMKGFAAFSHSSTWRICSSAVTPFLTHSCNCPFASLMMELFFDIALLFDLALSGAFRRRRSVRILPRPLPAHPHDLHLWPDHFRRQTDSLLTCLIIIELPVHSRVFMDITSQLPHPFSIFRSYLARVPQQPAERHGAMSPLPPCDCIPLPFHAHQGSVHPVDLIEINLLHTGQQLIRVERFPLPLLPTASPVPHPLDLIEAW